MESWAYFGDIDCEGLRIASFLAKDTEAIGAPTVRPHLGAYGWLVRHGRCVRAHLLRMADVETSRWPSIRSVAAADAAVASVSLIPQEWLGADVLASAEALDGTLPPPPFVPEWVWNNEV